MILKDDTYMVIKVINSKKCFVSRNKSDNNNSSFKLLSSVQPSLQRI